MNETYTQSDTSYTIHDYSMSQNSKTIYLTTSPDYPSFVLSTGDALKLCYYHDVADCLTLDKYDGKLAPFSYAAWRYSYSPTMNIADSSITMTSGDELWYCQTSSCSNPEAKLYRSFSRWIEDPLSPEPTDALKEGTHYYICYNSSTYNILFPLAQIYIAEMIDKISLSDLSSFLTQGVTEQWDFSGGDQAYGDSIMFSESCSAPSTNKMILNRKSSDGYDSVDITTFSEQIDAMF